MAETLFVRPVTGSYGAEDGLTYDTAFKGFADISWGAGAGKVSAGDTLYVCGTFEGETLTIGDSGTLGSEIIIRGDYPGDPGILMGGPLITGAWANVLGETYKWEIAYAYTTLLTLYIDGLGCWDPAANVGAIAAVGEWSLAGGTTVYLGYDYDPSTIDVRAVIATNIIHSNGKDYFHITGLTFKEMGTNGVYIDFNSDHIYIYNNSFYAANFYPIRIVGDNSYIYIYNNSFKNHHSTTESAIHSAAGAGTLANIYICYNKFLGNGGGIRFTNAQATTYIYNNLFANNFTYGAVRIPEGATLKNNLFFYNSGKEVYVTSLDAHSNNCYYTGVNPAAIYYNGTLYDYSDIVAAFEASAVVTNPYPNLVESFTAVHAAQIASDGTIYAGVETKVIKSIDGGATWSDCGTATLTFAVGTKTYVHLDLNDYIYATSNDPAAANQGLWRSIDGGSTWARVLDGSAWSNGCWVWGFDYYDANILYCSNYGTDESHVYKSIDKGLNWSSVFDASLLDTHIHQVCVDKSNGYVYCNTGDINDLHYLSIDEGVNWNPIFSYLKHTAGTFGANGYCIFGSDYGRPKIFKTTNIGANVDLKFYSNDSLFYEIGGDMVNGYYLAVSAAATTAANKTTFMLFSSDHGETWFPFMPMRVNSTSEGYFKVSKKAVDGKVIVSGKNEAGSQISYLINLNRLAAWDGRLPANSLCRDAGIAVAGLTTDFEGKPVPMGSAPDIGAYEFPVPSPMGLNLGLGGGGRMIPPRRRRR